MKKVFVILAFLLVVGSDLALLGFEINSFAVILISLGFLLLLAEFHFPGFGAFGIAGMFFLIMGSVLLIPTSPPKITTSEELNGDILLATIIPPIFFGIFFGFALIKSIQIRMKESIFKSLVGSEALAIDDISGTKYGYVKFQGEYWRANSNEKIKSGEKVKILEKRGHILLVGKISII